MEATITKLIWLAVIIGVTHTAMGPDHYVPFIAMSKAGRWSFRRTLLTVWACGLAHVLSSVAIGGVGIALGWAVGSMELFESARGGLAGWLLLGFGLAYFVWGVRRAIRNKPHAHVHVHADGTVHAHEHTHHGEHVHVHHAGVHASSPACGQPDGGAAPLRSTPSSSGVETAVRPAMTGWILFTIFIFGPCEPLIPLLMVPAAAHTWWGIVAVSLVFAVATLATMTAFVTVAYYGLTRVNLPSLERYTHAFAGAALLLCGLAIKMGL